MSNENLKKKWKTKSGLKVELYAYKEGQDYPYIGACLRDDGKWIEAAWTEDFVYYNGDGLGGFDLVEVGPYDDFKVDDKVLVSHDGVNWVKRYFAGVTKHGKPYTIQEADCCSSDATHTAWKYCKKWEEGNE